MKRTLLKRRTTLKAKKPLNRVSQKKLFEIKGELATRKALCERAGGTWVFEPSLTGGYCKGGLCEYCNSPPDFRRLRPHEEIFRGHAGKLSMENSKMACGACHSQRHGRREV